MIMIRLPREFREFLRLSNQHDVRYLLMDGSGVEFGDCYGRRETKRIDGVETSVISYLDLVENKRASGRLKDLADLEELGEL